MPKIQKSIDFFPTVCYNAREVMIMKTNALTQGPIFKSLLAFSLPMIITNTVSILFHAADVAVLALLVDGPAVAAVGACGSLITLLVSLFTCLATGANVLISKRIGAEDEIGTRRAVGTSLTIGLISGFILMAIAQLFARQFLIWMDCQPDVLDMATLYMRIYFLGMPILMLNSFTVSALRASGDSLRPMIYMLISGATNVVANFIFVSVFHMTVEGVAIATVLSSALTLTFALIRLCRSRGICRVEAKYLGIGKEEFIEIVRVGIPSCFSALSFFVANVILASKVNSMGTNAMTANAISGQFDGIIYTVGAAIASATSVMIAQNFGARQPDRIKKALGVGVAYATAVSLVLGISFVLLAEPLLGILSDDPDVIAIAKDRMTLLCLTYFITSIMEVFSFSLRALRRQKSTMVVGAVCGFGIRVLWAFFAWPLYPTLSMLFACFGISAGVAILIYLFVYRGVLREFNTEWSA